MAQDKRPISIADMARNAQIEAVLDQMYGYFRREAAPRPVWTDLDTARAA
ncbi:hypothetical protein [Paracoccus spongiarum]|uniref:Uncharacterized protein n=1 Tax=Paracoccus spongiarum TaxID=3064387 RepID=A0ABT9J9K8_9RHOB|nr:hypothetical protein [Paracoccus sp. 2205BS29-5]MDP5306410.1 hypothetical protein [Paracoccus sp. 2205BS29-5]